MTEVSVIIPVYNVEKYLAKCLDSVINQTLKDIEIICINDGSTDGSLKILQDYAKKDDRIKVINQENMGQGSARNKGLDIAVGKYCYFVDSDDWIELNTIEKLVKIISENDVDAVVHGANVIAEDDFCLQVAEDNQEWFKDYSKNNGIHEIPLEISHKIASVAWDKLYKTDIINKYHCRFPERLINEDEAFLWIYMLHCRNYYYLNDRLYNYLRRADSTMATRDNSPKVLDILEIEKIIYNTVKEHKNIKDYQKYLTKLYVKDIKDLFSRMPKQYRKVAFRKIKEYYQTTNHDKKVLKIYLKLKIKPIFKFFEHLFSLKNSSDKKHKIITIFGLKLKFKRKKKNFQKKIFKNYNKTLTKLRKDVHHRKLRVCFLVNETAKWNAQSVYNELKKSPYFEPFIVVTNLQNRTNRPSYSHLLEFYRSCADDVKIGWDEQTKQGIDLKNFSPDIVFYQQPWELYKNQDVKYVSNFALTYHFSYAMSDSIHCIKSMYKDFYSLVYKYFVFSKAEEDEYKSEMHDKGANLAVVGHPKLDVYKGYKEEDYEHKYVIYAPHHSFEKDSLNFATFQWNGKYILEYAEEHPEFDWVFKPHPRFKSAVIQNNIMSAEEIEEYYKRWEKIGICYNDGLYFDLFKQAKCLITDCGSFLIEFLPTKQPVIHLRNSLAKKQFPSEQIAADAYYKAWNLKELEQLLSQILINKTDNEKTERLKVLNKLKINKIDASKNILSVVKTDLGLI